MPLALVTAPQTEPLDVATDVKDHLRLDDVVLAADTSDLTKLVKAARERAEGFWGYALITQEWDLFFDAFPSGSEIEIPRPPLQGITWFKYYDPDGNLLSLTENTDFLVDKISKPGWIVLASGASWPDVQDRINAVNIRFTAGFGDNATDVPERTRLAMLQLISQWYEHREPFEAAALSPVPESWKGLLRPDRNFSF